jgi:hypothetical protein
MVVLSYRAVGGCGNVWVVRTRVPAGTRILACGG